MTQTPPSPPLPPLPLALLNMTAVAGEVVVSGSKVRAVSHFPSVRLANVRIARMTGRWFYG